MSIISKITRLPRNVWLRMRRWRRKHPFFTRRLANGFLALLFVLINLITLNLLDPNNKVQAVSVGPRTATASGDCTNVAAANVDWTSPGNAFSNNATYAQATGLDGTSSDLLRCVNFGFSIPTSNVQVDGITVAVERKGSTATADLTVNIVKGGTVGTTNRSTGAAHTASDVSVNFGGATDTWGETWTGSDINSATFGAAYAATKASSAGAAVNVTVDVITITVDYTLTVDYNQSSYRWFSNADAVGSPNVGAALNSVAQDTATTAPNEGTPFRLRLTMHVTTNNATAAANIFKLQYAVKSGTCDTSFSGEVFSDVTTSSEIAYYNNTNATDAAAPASNANDPGHSGHTKVMQEYQESGNFGVASTINIGNDGLWDISLVDNGAAGNTTYCFRVVTSSGSQLAGYTVVPEITTGLNQYDQSGYRWFENNDNPTYVQSLSGDGDDEIEGITRDSSGNMYVISQNASAGTTSGGYDNILQKFNSSGVEQWSKTWGGTTNDGGNDIVIDSSGNIYITGQTASTGFTAGVDDLFLQKYDSSGVEQWTKTWGGDAADRGNGIVLDASGNIYVAGQTASTGFTAGSTDLVLQKYNSSGVEQWTKTWGGAGIDIGNDVVIDSSNNVYVTGTTTTTGFTAGGNDFLLQKYDSSGVEQWTKTWGDTGTEQSLSITMDSSSNIYLAGYTASAVFTAGSDDLVVQKYDSSGVEQWTKTWGGTSADRGNSIGLDVSGNVYVGGYTASSGFTAGSEDFVLQKYNSSGAEQWTKTWGGTANDYGLELATDSFTNIYIAGNTYSPEYAPNGLSNAVFAKFNSSGSIANCSSCVDRATSETNRATSETDRATSETDRATSETDRATSETDRAPLILVICGTHQEFGATWGSTGNESLEGVVTDSAGNIYVSGFTASTGFTAGSNDVLLQKYDAYGAEQWTKTWGGTGTDVVNDIALDSSGNIYVTGYTGSSGFIAGGQDFFIQKYNSSGVEQWTKTWGGGDLDQANELSLDSSGNIYVVGGTSSSGFTTSSGLDDVVVQKYNSSGVEQWTKTWGGDSLGIETANAVALDSSGNIYITGYTTSTAFTSGSEDFLLQKYDSSGTEQWTKTWGGTGTDTAHDVKVDSSGNIFVLGTTNTASFTSGNTDVVLQKYNSSGAEQWTKTWGDAATSVDSALMFNLDSSGNIFVGGFTSSTNISLGLQDLYLQKYNSSGVEQWTKVWGGTAADTSRYSTIDDVGNIFIAGYTMSTGLTFTGQDTFLIKSSTEDSTCLSLCRTYATSETDRATSETDRSVTETDRATSETDRATSETDRSITEVKRFETMPSTRSFVDAAYNNVAQNTAASVATSDVALRLYMAVHATQKPTSASGLSLKLQYSAKSGTCDTSFSGESYTDVTTTTPIAYYPATNFTDGVYAILNSGSLTHSSDTMVGQSYVESTTITNPVAMRSGYDYVWDLSVTPYEALNGSYCLRFVKSDNNTLTTYGQVAEVQLTAPSTRQHLRHGKYFDAEAGTRQAFYW